MENTCSLQYVIILTTLLPIKITSLPFRQKQLSQKTPTPILFADHQINWGWLPTTKDPENLGRIKISFFWMEDKFTTPG